MLSTKIKITAFLLLLSLFGFVWFFNNDPIADKKELLILDMVGKNPGENRLESTFNDPEKLKEHGYSGQVKRDFLTGAVTFDSLGGDIFPEGSASRKWVNETETRIRKQIKDAKDAGIKIYYFTDIIILPKKIKELYRDQICDANGNISFEKAKTKEIHKIMIEEIFRKFPEVDGLVIRTGENYVYDLPYHVGNNPLNKLKPIESHIDLIKFLREEVCIKRNKKIIYRTWSFDGFHTDPNYYLNVTDNIEPHENLIFSIKHTSGDFLRTIPFNSTLAIGDHKQIVEIQCQREYEGKGAHPNYIAEGVINGFEEFNSFKQKIKRMLQSKSNSLEDIKNDKNFVGVWTWSRGGGWYGPHIQNELWCDLNAYVISQWAGNPDLREEDIFNKYCVERLGLKQEEIQKFRNLNMLSAKGVIRGHSSISFPVNIVWARDDFFGGINDLEQTFEWLYDNDKIDEALEEKQEGEDIWAEILKISHELDIQDPHLKDFIVASCKYGKIKFSIINQAWIIMLNGFEGDQTGIYDKAAINKALANYDNYWLEFEALENQYPNSPSIYRPYSFVFPEADGKLNKVLLQDGMKRSVDKYRSLMEGGSISYSVF